MFLPSARNFMFFNAEFREGMKTQKRQEICEEARNSWCSHPFMISSVTMLAEPGFASKEQHIAKVMECT